MAYSKALLNKIGGQALRGGAAQVFTYLNSGGDTVTTTGYFNAMAPILGVGDLIIVINYSSSKPATCVIYTVSQISSGVVTIASALAAA